MFFTLSNNFKNQLLEISQLHFGAARPEYTHFRYGPANDAVFLCVCTFQNEITLCQGRTKKEAEIACSKDMMDKLKEKFFDEKQHQWKPKEEIIHPIYVTVGSYVQNLHQPPNTRLRFLGNAVLRSYIANYLFHKYPQFQEDILTRIISQAMDKKNRASISKKLALNQYFNHKETSRTLSDILDITVGLLALADKENVCNPFLKAAYQNFIESAIKDILEDKAFHKGQCLTSVHIQTDIHNHKSNLFDLAQKSRMHLPCYEIIETSGSSHDPLFQVRCNFSVYQTIGSGKTIKSAEQNASYKILKKICGSQPDTIRNIAHEAHQQYALIYQDTSLDKQAQFALSHAIGHPNIGNCTYLNEALTHPSISRKNNYQRLELLGDALLREILLLHISEKDSILNSIDDISEKISFLVSASTQAKIAKALTIDKYIFADTIITEAILSDVLESLIAAIYLNKNNLIDSKQYVLKWYADTLIPLLPQSILPDSTHVLSLKISRNDEVKETVHAEEALLSQPYSKHDSPEQLSSMKRSNFDKPTTVDGKPSYAEIAKKALISTNQHLLFQAKREGKTNNKKTAIDLDSLVDFPAL